MASEISFESYKVTQRDRYRKIREGNSDVTFSYLVNYVVADMDDRVITIDVDNHFIEMCSKLDEDEAPDSQKHHYMPQSGEVVANPIGEQLISFCETGFKEDMELTLRVFGMGESLREDTPEAGAMREKYGFKKSPPNVKMPESDEELDIIYYENYEYLATVAEDVIRSNLYVNLFPPLVRSRSYKMCRVYFNYIIALQQEYKKLLDFCFNMDFYREELDGITAASRFYLYCETTDAVPIQKMNMSFRFTRHGLGKVSVPIRDKHAHEQLKQNPAEVLGGIDIAIPI